MSTPPMKIWGYDRRNTPTLAGGRMFQRQMSITFSDIAQGKRAFTLSHVMTRGLVMQTDSSSGSETVSRERTLSRAGRTWRGMRFR